MFNKKTRLNKLKKKILKWKKEGYKIDELENLVNSWDHQLQNEKVKKIKFILITTMVIISVVVLISIYYYSGNLVNPPSYLEQPYEDYGEQNENEDPIIYFEQDFCNHTLKVTGFSRPDIKWRDLSVKGRTSFGVDENVETWNIITQCYGPVTITYKPTNKKIASYWFSYIPDIEFEMNDDTNTLTIVEICPVDARWGNLEINGNCNTTNHGQIIKIGDVIENCQGIINIVWGLTDTQIISYNFTE